MTPLRVRCHSSLLVVVSVLTIGCVPEDLYQAQGSIPGCKSNGKSNEKNPRCDSFGLSKADAISHGSISKHPCIVRNGRVKCWGENFDGHLGVIGNDSYLGDHPDDMGESLPYVDLGSDASVIQVAVTNASNRCALLSDGTVKCWGFNTFGNLGYGDLVDRIGSSVLGDRLERVNLGAGARAVALVAGNRTYCALLATG